MTLIFDLISNENQNKIPNKVWLKINFRSLSSINALSESIFNSFNVKELFIICTFGSTHDLVFNRLDRLNIISIEWTRLGSVGSVCRSQQNTYQTFNSLIYYFENNNKCKQLLNIISKLTNLVNLNIEGSIVPLNDKNFYKYCKQLANQLFTT